MKGLVVFQLLIGGGGSFGFAQTPAPPPPLVRPTPAAKSELTDAQFEAKIAKTLNQRQAWKAYELPGFEIKVNFPREPVRQTESFYDQTLGNARSVVYVAVGDDGTYLAGHVRLPYAISDENLLREAYQETIKEFAAEPGMKFENPKDFYINGKLGVEAVSIPSDSRYLPTRLRVFTVGRAICILIAVPSLVPGEGDPPTRQAREKVSAEVDSFFASATPVTAAATANPTSQEPTLRGTFSNRLYRSEYFGFTLLLPEGWSRVGTDDVDGIRKWGRDYLAHNSEQPLPELKTKQNLATFVSKPLGNERVAGLAINLGIPISQPDAAMQMSKLTEGVLGRVQTYKLQKGATRTKLGNTPAVSIEGTMKIGEQTQYQIIYFIERKGYVLGFTLNYYDEVDRQKAEAALQSLKIEGP